MLKNFFYSLVLHIVVFLLYIVYIKVSLLNFNSNSNSDSLTIKLGTMIDIDELKNVKTTKNNDLVKNLSLDKKIELFQKIQNRKSFDIEKKQYEKSKKYHKKQIKNKNKNNLSQIANTNVNEFSYYYTPVYVEEDKINTKQKRKLIEDKLKKEKIREKMKKNKINPTSINKNDINEFKNESIEQIISKIEKKPVITKQDNKKNNNKKTTQDDINILLDRIDNINDQINKNSNTNVALTEIIDDNSNDENINNYDENEMILAEIFLDKNKIDEKYKNLTEDQIFTQEDLNKIKDNVQNKNNLLSSREKINIQKQIKSCYKMAMLKTKKRNNSVVVVSVNLNIDGYIQQNSIKILNIDKKKKLDYNTVLENVKNSLAFCSPLRGLPVNKYKAWQKMIFVFDNNVN